MLNTDETRRYARHLSLPEIGIAGQEKLKGGKVLVVGAGGLGSPAALYLAAAGVGCIGLVDFDRVDLSNLQRQILYDTPSVGSLKLDIATRRLQSLNPSVTIVPHETRLTSSNALEILGQYDVIVDGSDNFPTRYLVNDACVLLGKPDVYGSIFRFFGQASVFLAPTGPCYRCMFPEPPPPGLVPSCEEGGVLGAVPGLIGIIQACEAIKILLGIGETLIGRMLLIDVARMSFRELRIPRNPDCVVCGSSPSVTSLIDYDAFCCASITPEDSTDMTPKELATLLAGGQKPKMIDVRETSEWNEGHIDGAIHIPLRDLPRRLNELSKSDDIVCYCAIGGRSSHAVRILGDAGFKRVANLVGGIKRWVSDGLPVV